MNLLKRRGLLILSLISFLILIWGTKTADEPHPKTPPVPGIQIDGEFQVRVADGKLVFSRLTGQAAEDEKLKTVTFATEENVYVVSMDPRPCIIDRYPAASTKGDFILVDKKDNRLYFYRDARLIKRYPVATGKQPVYTPEGRFKIAVKVPEPRKDDQDSQLGARWMGLSVPEGADRRGPANDERAPAGLKYGIHGTDDPDSIGKHISGGCIRMHNQDIIELYSFVDVGTPVEIRGPATGKAGGM